MNAQVPHYSLIIEWSDEDQCYLVSSPEWAAQYATPIAEGNTLEEAAARGRNALAHMVEIAQQEGQLLPTPRLAIHP